MMKHVSLALAAVALGMWGLSAGYAEQAQSGHERVQEQLGSEGNAMGVPEPGTVQDMESTEKKRDAGKVEASESLERLPYFVQGEILKIDGEHFEINDHSGERVRLMVNADTNLDCAAVPTDRQGKGDITSQRLSPEDQAPEASGRQIEQGQRKDETARGAGFQIGTCDFQAGDIVKAEIDDNNRVTTLKYLTGSQESGSGKDRGMKQ